MIVEIVAAVAIFAAGYKYGAYVKRKAVAVLAEAKASAEAEVAQLKDAAAAALKTAEAQTKYIVPAVAADVKAAL